MDGLPDEVLDVEADSAGRLTKSNAERLYLLVMPLADRNLFVALKQERWAGRDMEEVRYVYKQLLRAVEHMHEKGVLHADIKTLNIVRVGQHWKLIDLDAACEIGTEFVGHKSSSAYVPPELIYVDEAAGTACVRSVVAVESGKASYECVKAHPSFDVWSLGCILYQMCTADVRPLFAAGQDDNLSDDRTEEDSLFDLAEWSLDRKEKKLSRVVDPLARNLLGQMLHRDPLTRPSLARVLAHPFISSQKVARMVGEEPRYDVFLSYRVASDSAHVERLYTLLTAQGFKVYWDKLCLEPGVDWEQGTVVGQ
jgi:serine/threonine protein kinase